MKLDLHIHTTDSDGTDTPTQVVESAKAAGFEAIAITDHDTLGGVAEGMAAGERVGLRVIPGCEISAGGVSEVHVLGYGAHAGLRNRRYALRYARRTHSSYGEDDSAPGRTRHRDRHRARKELHQRPGGSGTPGARTARGRLCHIDKRTRSNKYLAPGAAAYVPRRKLETRMVISMIRDCGGVPVVAHPGRGLLGYVLAGGMPARVEKEGAYGR